MLPIHNFVLHHSLHYCFTIETLVEVLVCHEDMTGNGEENVMGISIFPFCIEFLMFWWENPSLLDYDDVIMLHQ